MSLPRLQSSSKSHSRSNIANIANQGNPNSVLREIAVPQQKQIKISHFFSPKPKKVEQAKEDSNQAVPLDTGSFYQDQKKENPPDIMARGRKAAKALPNKVKEAKAEVGSKQGPPAGGFKAMDLVWAAMKGYPEWPAIICNSPEERSFFNAKNELHVQFLDTPVSRAWLPRSKVRPLDEEAEPVKLNAMKFKKGKKHRTKFNEALLEVKRAIEMNVADRYRLVKFKSLSMEDNSSASSSKSADEEDDETSASEAPASDSGSDHEMEVNELEDESLLDEKQKLELQKRKRIREMLTQLTDLKKEEMVDWELNTGYGKRKREEEVKKEPKSKRSRKEAEVEEDEDEESDESEIEYDDDSSDDESAKKKKKQVVTKTTKASSKSKPVLIEPLSEYMLLRQKNIEDREKAFMEFGLGVAKKRVSAAFEREAGGGDSGKKNYSKRGLAALPTQKRAKEEIVPRKSKRIQNIDADTGLQLPEKEPTSSTRYEPDRSLLPLAELDMETLGQLSKMDESEQELKDKAQYLKKAAELRVEPDMKASLGENPEQALKEMEINTYLIAKVVPWRIYSMAVHPTNDKLLIAAADKSGCVGLWDVMDTASQTHGVSLFQPHASPINALSFSSYNQNQLISSSYDGSVRVLDLAAQKLLPLFGDPDLTLCYHKEMDANTVLTGTGSAGIVGTIDRRVSASNQFAVSTRVFMDKSSIKTIDLHPTNKNLLLCSNNKAQIAIYDLRMSKGEDKLCPRLLSFSGHARSISSAFFSPVSGKRVVSVAFDDKVNVYDTSSITSAPTDETLDPIKSIKHNNQTGRWLTTFKAEWHPLREDVFAMGALKTPRQIDMFNGDGTAIQALKGEHLGSVCSIVKFHPTMEAMVGGNSSGRVHVFMK